MCHRHGLIASLRIIISSFYHHGDITNQINYMMLTLDFADFSGRAHLETKNSNIKLVLKGWTPRKTSMHKCDALYFFLCGHNLSFWFCLLWFRSSLRNISAIYWLSWSSKTSYFDLLLGTQAIDTYRRVSTCRAYSNTDQDVFVTAL